LAQSSQEKQRQWRKSWNWLEEMGLAIRTLGDLAENTLKDIDQAMNIKKWMHSLSDSSLITKKTGSRLK